MAAKKAKKSAKKVAKKATKSAVKKKTTAKKSTKKSAAKKTAVTSTTKQPKQSNVLPIILLIIGAAIIIYGLMNLLGDSEETPVVAASVNGVEITTKQLETQYAILPAQYKEIYTEEIVLQQLIDEEILLQYGAEHGVATTPEAINEEIQEILESGQITILDLQENLNNFNLTIEDFERLIERKLLIEQSMNVLLADFEPATEEEARTYYDANSAEFVQEEQVTVRHILIASQRENAAQFSKDLKEQVEAGADFCELVTEESDDKGSVEACGEYTFPRGYMVPEFEKASFTMKPGDVTVVQSTFGYHIIEKLADVEASVIAFKDAQDGIIQLLTQQKQVELYKDFIDTRKAEGDIQIYS